MKIPQLRRAEAVTMHLAGMSNVKIAAALEVTPALIANDLYNARNQGQLLRPARSAPSASSAFLLRRMGGSYADMGRMMDVLDALTRDEAKWLVGAIPKGMRLCEFLASMVKDVYAEEHPQ